MPLTVLTDNDVKDLLDTLNREDIEVLQQSLRVSLHEYSTSIQDYGCAAKRQPQRTVIQSPNGVTSLFMPSTSSLGLGMKVVTLGAPASPSEKQEIAQDVTPRGALTIMGPNGEPTGFLNAEELTAFRTALSSSLLISRRSKLSVITVFGAGKQAFWHLRLALTLRGSSIKQVNIINRTFSQKAINLMQTMNGVPQATREAEGWEKTTFTMLSPAYGEYDRLIKDHIRSSDAIFCTTPSTKPLFDHNFLTATEGRKKGRLIVAIGSYKPHMIELDPAILKQAVKPHHGHHYHRHAQEGGCVVVDALHACIKEAGEVIQADLKPDQLVELGELVMLEGSGHHRNPSLSSDSSDNLSSSFSAMSTLSIDPERENNGGSIGTTDSSASSGSKLSLKSFFHGPGEVKEKDKKHKKDKEDGFCKWMSTGNVIYKSVGMGLMDLVVGGDIVEIARMRGIGTTIEGF